MTSELQFGFLDKRLIMAAPPELLQLTREHDATFDATVADLENHQFIAVAPREDSGRLFGINARAIGRAKSLEKRRRIYTAVNGMIGSLVEAQAGVEQIGNPGLRLEAYQPTPAGDFGMLAQLQLPNVSTAALALTAKTFMVNMASELKVYGKTFDPADAISVEVGNDGGVSLGQGTDSRVHNEGAQYASSTRVVEVSSSNVFYDHEPLIYVVGMTALARAAELVSA